MALPRGTASIVAAVEQGRVHTQRFLKNPSATTGARWTDSAFASGQPAYDPRIGTALTFKPETGTCNECIYTGHAPSEKHLFSTTLRADGAGGPISILLLDLLGYYPLIDGDSTEFQPFDNTLTLPRCTDGSGVLPVLVSSVAPAIVTTPATIVYTDANGVSQTSPPFGVATSSTPGQVLNTPASTGATPGGLAIPLNSSTYGVRSVDGIQYTNAPGGLQSLYLIRPIATFTCNGDRFLATERTFPNCPVIPDGTAFSLFFYQQASSATSFFGHFTFIH
jgi:hypothetical protein